MANLLIETNLFEGRVNEDESGRTIVKGILQRAGAENQNGRIYPKPILMREAKKYETLIKERRALGELDHPDSSVINLKNVSHNVREIHWDNDDLVGLRLRAAPWRMRSRRDRYRRSSRTARDRFWRHPVIRHNNQQLLEKTYENAQGEGERYAGIFLS